MLSCLIKCYTVKQVEYRTPLYWSVESHTWELDRALVWFHILSCRKGERTVCNALIKQTSRSLPFSTPPREDGWLSWDGLLYFTLNDVQEISSSDLPGLFYTLTWPLNYRKQWPMQAPVLNNKYLVASMLQWMVEAYPCGKIRSI